MSNAIGLRLLVQLLLQETLRDALMVLLLHISFPSQQEKNIILKIIRFLLLHSYMLFLHLQVFLT